MRLLKKHIGRVVELQIWDHNTKGVEKVPTRCWVVGRIVSVDRLNLCLGYWRAEHSPEVNNENHNILRSAIIEVTFYQPIS